MENTCQQQEVQTRTIEYNSVQPRTLVYNSQNIDKIDDSYYNVEKRVMMLKAWSFSRMSLYESCPKRAKLQYIDKIEELPRELQPGQTEFANDRGSRIHEAAELYVKGEIDEFIPELTYYKEELEFLRLLKSQEPDRVVPEEMWCFDDTWGEVATDDFDNIWLRVISDLFVWLDDKTVCIVDLKTGKRYGNELKHGQQLTLYALATAMKFPQVETIYTELWYLDLNEINQRKFTAQQARQFLRNWNDRALTLTSDDEFLAKPSRSSCMFCPYKQPVHDNKWVKGTGDCNESVN